VINIEKESGTRRARSEANRVRALTEYLTKIGMTVAELEELRRRAERPFYTAGDVEKMSFGASRLNGHDPDEIVIPPHQIYGCLAQAADTARSSTRIATREQIRSVIAVTDPIYTGKHHADGTWERFAVVTGGTGAKLSNQRALRRNDYLGPFTASLTVEFDNALVDPGKVTDFLAYAGREVGIGASRKLGWGRFDIAT